MTTPYFRKYIAVAPFALALWRSVEAQAIADACRTVFLSKHRSPRDVSDFPRPVLDLGCGFGEFAGVFFDHQVEVGIDISLEDLLRAKKGKRYKSLQIADARRLPFPDNTFRTVISVSVLEHITHQEKAVQEAYRVLKKDGFLVYTVPTVVINDYLFYPRLFAKLGLKNLRRWYTRKFHWSFKHTNVITPGQWVRMTQNAGFKILLKQGMFSPTMVAVFDLALLPALPSQALRWLFGTRAIWGLPLKQPVLETLFDKLYKPKPVTESNIIIVAQKP